MHLSGGWNVLRRGRAVGRAEVAWTQYLCGQRGAMKKIWSQEAGTSELCVRTDVPGEHGWAAGWQPPLCLVHSIFLVYHRQPER